VVAGLDTLVAGAGHAVCAEGRGPLPVHAVGPRNEVTPVAAGCGCPQPAAVDGQPITAAHLRSLLEQLDALCPGGLQAPTGGTLDIALTDPRTGALRATLTRAELERLVRRGCPEHPGEACRCSVLDRPAPVDRYVPTPAQRRFVSTRDRTCRHPGCRNAAAWSDLDHVIPHGVGSPTACENLCCLCRRHHRLKTHAPGWRFVMTTDGVLTVTTPSGVTRTTRPPGLHHPPGWSASPPDDDPPPFWQR
jgi:hypothetical protein